MALGGTMSAVDFANVEQIITNLYTTKVTPIEVMVQNNVATMAVLRGDHGQKLQTIDDEIPGSR